MKKIQIINYSVTKLSKNLIVSWRNVSYENTIKKWNTETGSCLSKFKGSFIGLT